MRKPVPKFVLSYEAPEHSRWSASGAFEPNFFVDIEKNLNTKIKAFYKYKSQVKPKHRDKATILSQAEYRGREVGRYVCEAFFAHRFMI